MKLIQEIEREQMKAEVPEFGVGDTVEVHVKISEGDRERIHVFTGIVISRKGGSLREMFTVRRIVAGEGVERTFPLHSPAIAKIKRTRRGAVRRAKLNYLRKRVGKATQVKEKRSTKASK
jgi:large subunit ribosomal protein L19